MKFKSILEDFNTELWGHHFVVSKDIAEKFIKGNNRRVICNINGDVEYQCAIMPDKKKGYLINVNKEIRKKANIKLGDKCELVLKKDDSKYGLPVPEEFIELLRQDPEGEKVFHALTMGKQRSLVYIIAKPKRSETRLHKAVVILDFLKENNGALDFKALNQAFKEAK